jgi:anti-sigma B factor antagonist
MGWAYDASDGLPDLIVAGLVCAISGSGGGRRNWQEAGPEMSGSRERSHGLAVATAVAVLPAEIDVSNADRVAGELFAAIKPGVRVAIVDMTLTMFCDSSGLRAIAQAHDRAQAQGAELRLVTASPGVLRVLGVTGLDTVVPVYSRLDDALAAAPGGPGPGVADGELA